MPRVRALRSFSPADAPAFPEGEVRDVTAAQAEAYAPHVEPVEEAPKPKRAPRRKARKPKAD